MVEGNGHVDVDGRRVVADGARGLVIVTKDHTFDLVFVGADNLRFPFGCFRSGHCKIQQQVCI